LKCEKQKFPWQHTCVKKDGILESFNRELEEILQRERDEINKKEKDDIAVETKETTSKDGVTDGKVKTVVKDTNKKEEQTKNIAK